MSNRQSEVTESYFLNPNTTIDGLEFGVLRTLIDEMRKSKSCHIVPANATRRLQATCPFPARSSIHFSIARIFAYVLLSLITSIFDIAWLVSARGIQSRKLFVKIINSDVTRNGKRLRCKTGSRSV